MWQPPPPPAGATYTVARVGGCADADAIADLHTRSWQQAYSRQLSPQYLCTTLPPEMRAKWSSAARLGGPRGALGSDTLLVVVARDVEDKAIVGFACVDAQAAASEEKWGVLLDNLHVDAGHRRRGIATHLIKCCATWIEARHPGRPMHLTCYADNAEGRAAYDKARGAVCEHIDYNAPDGSVKPVVRYLWEEPRASYEAVP